MSAVPVDVATIRWPTEQMRRNALASAGVPRLLVIDGDHPPPRDLDEMEDWIRVPALEIDRRARVERLRARLSSGSESSPPRIDEDGLVHAGSAWVSVPPVEASLASALIASFGAVVARSELTTAAWPSGSTQRNALDVRILRLRRRLEDLGLAIRTVRSRGYLMEWAEARS